MKNSIKTFLALGLVGALGAGGSAMVAHAKGTSPTTVRDTRTAQAAQTAQTVDSEANEAPGNDANEANEAPGSQANEVPGNDANEASEAPGSEANDAAEMAQYQSLAKITSQQAQQAAEAARGSTATKVELSSEDGNLVYQVDFANAEVLVDAGNGQILKTEVAGQEQNDATEAPIQGSIQVPENDGGDQGAAQQ